MILQHPTLLLTQIKLAAAGLSLYDFGPKNPPNSQLFFPYCSPYFKNSESGLLQFYSTAQRNNTLVLCELGIFCNIIVHDRGEEEIYPDYVHCTEKNFYVCDGRETKKSMNGLCSKSFRKNKSETNLGDRRKNSIVTLRDMYSLF